MAILNTTLFFRNNRNYRVGSINLDLLISESHNFSSSITQFNVEEGSDISDHIRKELFQGEIVGKVTNFSLFQVGLTSNRAQEAYDKMKEIWNARQLVDIVTIYDVFNNVGITNMNTGRSSGSGEAIEFNVSFREVNIVKLQEIVLVANVKLANMDSTNNKQASPKLEVGTQQGVSR